MDQVVAQALTIYNKLAARGNGNPEENGHALTVTAS